MGSIEPQQYQTKTGCSVTIRTARPSDAQALVDLSLHTLQEEQTTDTMNMLEFQLAALQMQERIPLYEQQPSNILLVAEVEGNVVGMVRFDCDEEQSLKHQGMFGMGVRKAWRNQRVGRALLQTLLAWGQTNPAVEKIRLGVLADNARAIALYSSLGFIEEGRLVRQMKLADNSYRDYVLMYKFVEGER
jgi:RimJ/RimL family protein N-acetyltransferase